MRIEPNEKRTSGVSRRDVILSGLGAAAVLTVGLDRVRAADASKGPALRVAHLTDMHVKPEHRSPDGYAAALASLNKLDPQPAFIISGGDHVMDTLESTKARAVQQWEVYDKVLAGGTKLPVRPILGNHDVFGWSRKEPIPDEQTEYGKAMALDRLKLKQSYYSFDAGGWHFVMLDNIAKKGAGYYGDMDDEQTEWLQGDLQANRSKPVVVFSHIPFASLCAFFFYYADGKKPKEFWRIGDNLMHHDSKPLLELFGRNNVKLCVSGHIHLLDRVQYMGLNFICDGAVSGAWWRGPFQECVEGYGVLDFYPDGTFDHQYVAYGWDAKKS
jgi:3',5'-cyclic AMP phosphodiesterase CpdA